MEISMSSLLMVFDQTYLYTRELVYIRSSKTILTLNIWAKLIFKSIIFGIYGISKKYRDMK